jgi:hypothetical protein
LQFSASVVQNFDQRNEDSLQWYDQRLEQVRLERKAAMDLWNEDKKKIEKSYWAAMSAYEAQVDSGSTTAAKPLEPFYGSCPCNPDPKKPFLTNDISVDAIAGMVKIPGFQSAEGGAKITIGFQGFDKGTMKKGGAAGAITYAIQYKHPIHVKIEDTDGTIVMDKILPSSTGFQTTTSPKFKNDWDFKAWWIDNEETFWAERQIDIINTVIGKLNAMLADDIGFAVKSRTSEFYTVKGKNYDYTDLLEAFQSAQDGLLQLGSDVEKNSALEYLGTAVVQYEAIIAQSDINDKKAKISKKVTAAMFCNIAECYLWMDDFSKAELYLNKAANLGVGKYKRHGNSLKPFLLNQKKRFSANQF